MVSHNVLNAHAAAVREFRRLLPGGLISINLNSDWAEPLTPSKKDQVRTCTGYVGAVGRRVIVSISFATD